jgi:hypothetical protein
VFRSNRPDICPNCGNACAVNDVYCSKCGKNLDDLFEKLELEFVVRIENKPLDTEKIARFINLEGASLLRKATLSIAPELIRLSCRDDFGKVINIQ